MKAATDKLSLALRAVADPTRRKILRMLQPGTPRKNPGKSAEQDGCTASDIEQRIKLAQPTISHHMKILKNAGLVETTKQGTWVRYRRVESALRTLRKGLLEEL
jgi:ArsR family transcriptional regulator, arsenate/arsenite/antimonite-responsive transcriptional repressor